MEKRREVGQHPVLCWWQQKSGIGDFLADSIKAIGTNIQVKVSQKPENPLVVISDSQPSCPHMEHLGAG